MVLRPLHNTSNACWFNWGFIILEASDVGVDDDAGVDNRVRGFASFRRGKFESTRPVVVTAFRA